jgi:hypothetical protein
MELETSKVAEVRTQKPTTETGNKDQGIAPVEKEKSEYVI